MSNTGPHRCLSLSRSQQHCIPRNLVAWLVLAALYLTLAPAQADEKEDEYLRIYDVVQSADTLNHADKLRPALAKYREAETALLAFKRNYPEWNPASVSYRLNYLAVQIAAVSDKITNPPPAPTGKGSPAATQPAGGSVREVKLLEPGAEPRQQIRLHPKPGDKQFLEISMKPTMQATVGQMVNPPMKMPEMKVALQLTVSEVSSEGNISYQTVLSDANVAVGPGADPQMLQAVQSAMSSLKGLSGSGTISNRGFDKGSEFKAPADANPAVRQALEQMKEITANLAIPLPEEAIGPGAKWQATSVVKSQGITLDQTAVYQLVSLDSDRAAVTSSITQHAANQKIQNPAMPGMQADLTKMEGTGSSKVSLLLTQILPSSGTMDFHSEVNMSMNMAGQNQPMTMKADVSVTVQAK